MIVTQKEIETVRKATLAEIEQVLKFDPDPERRAQAKAEYMRLTEPRKGEDQ